MPRSIEEIQRDIDQSRQNINAVARQTQRINEGLQVLDEQEKQIARNALAPTQIENRKMLSNIQSSMATIESSFSAMQANLSDRTEDIERASQVLQEVDVESINQSTRDMNELLRLADPQERSKLIEALNIVHDEKKKQLEQAYKEEKAELDHLIREKKNKLNELKRKIAWQRIKKIILGVLIAFVIVFILSFAVRWGTMLRNRLSQNKADTELQTEQTDKSLNEEEKGGTEENRGIIEWIFPKSDGK